MIDYRKLLDDAQLNASTDNFISFLAKTHVELWAELLRNMQAQELRTMLPDIVKIAAFLDDLDKECCPWTNRNSPIVFLNALGPKFKVLFPADNSFPNLILALNAAKDTDLLFSYIPHIRSATQLIPLFNMLNPEVTYTLIHELNDRIHLLNELSSQNRTIERILATNTKTLMFWKYYKTNMAKELSPLYKSYNTNEMISHCFNDMLNQRRIAFSYYWKDATYYRVNSILEEVNINVSTQEMWDTLSLQLLAIGDRYPSISMRIVFCLNVITERGYRAPDEQHLSRQTSHAAANVNAPNPSKASSLNEAAAHARIASTVPPVLFSTTIVPLTPGNLNKLNQSTNR